MGSNKTTTRLRRLATKWRKPAMPRTTKQIQRWFCGWVGILDFVCGDGLQCLYLLWVLCICYWIMVEKWRFCVATVICLFSAILGLICLFYFWVWFVWLCVWFWVICRWNRGWLVVDYGWFWVWVFQVGPAQFFLGFVFNFLAEIKI